MALKEKTGQTLKASDENRIGPGGEFAWKFISRELRGIGASLRGIDIRTAPANSSAKAGVIGVPHASTGSADRGRAAGELMVSRR